VLVRAWEGVLPTEISGRGVTYAEADTTEAALREAARVAEWLTDQFEGLRRELLGLRGGMGRKTMSSIGDVDERERRVMELLAEGHLATGIASRLGISRGTPPAWPCA